MQSSHKRKEPSVSSRRNEKKRSWRDKLDPDALDMLDACSYLDTRKWIELHDS